MSLLKYWHVVIYRVVIFYGWSRYTAWEITCQTPFYFSNMHIGLIVEINSGTLNRCYLKTQKLKNISRYRQNSIENKKYF